MRFIDAPLFDVKGDLIVTLLQPLLDGLPALLGPGTLDNIFDLTQLELFGVQLRSAMVNSSPCLILIYILVLISAIKS